MFTRFSYSVVKVSYAALILAFAVILCFLIGACLTMYVKTTQISQSIPYANPVIAVQPVNTDSCDADIARRITAVETELNYVAQQQHEALTDLRQETNNIIDKFSSWMAFWIAILALIGGALPLIIQHLLTKKTKLKLDKILSETSKTANTHQILLLISNLSLHEDNAVIVDSVETNKYFDIIIRETSENLRKLLAEIEEDNAEMNERDELHIINSLFQYCRLIDILLAHASRSNLRELRELQDQIKVLITDIINHTRYPRDLIFRRLQDLLPKLAHLHYR